MTKQIILVAVVLLLISDAKAEEIKLNTFTKVNHFYNNGNDCYLFNAGRAGGIHCVKRNKEKLNNEK